MSNCPQCGGPMEPMVIGDAGDKFLVCSHCQFKVDVPDQFEVTEVKETTAPDGTKTRIEITKKRSDMKTSIGAAGSAGAALPGPILALDETDLPEDIKTLIKEGKPGTFVSGDLPEGVLSPEDLKKLLANGATIEPLHEEDRQWLDGITKDLPDQSANFVADTLGKAGAKSQIVFSHVSSHQDSFPAPLSPIPSTSSESSQKADLSQVISLVKWLVALAVIGLVIVLVAT